MVLEKIGYGKRFEAPFNQFLSIWSPSPGIRVKKRGNLYSKSCFFAHVRFKSTKTECKRYWRLESFTEINLYIFQSFLVIFYLLPGSYDFKSGSFWLKIHVFLLKLAQNRPHWVKRCANGTNRLQRTFENQLNPFCPSLGTFATYEGNKRG